MQCQCHVTVEGHSFCGIGALNTNGSYCPQGKDVDPICERINGVGARCTRGGPYCSGLSDIRCTAPVDTRMRHSAGSPTAWLVATRRGRLFIPS